MSVQITVHTYEGHAVKITPCPGVVSVDTGAALPGDGTTVVDASTAHDLALGLLAAAFVADRLRLSA